MPSLTQRINDLAAAIATALKAQRGLQVFVGGKPASNEVLARASAPYAFTFSRDQSVCLCKVAPTASSNILVFVNGTQIATATFAVGATAGLLNFNTGLSYAVAKGDIIELRGVASPDATHADITILLKG